MLNCRLLSPFGVEILRDLYLHGRREGHLFYRDRKRDVKLKLPVDW